MKSSHRKFFTSLATTVLASLPASLQATTSGPVSTSYTTDDLFIGFTQSGNNNDYLIDIGQASNYVGKSAQTLAVGNIAADLSYVFGSGWATDPTISWGIAGTTHISVVGGDGQHTVYASRQGASATPWSKQATLSTPDARITTMAGAYNGKTSTANSTVAIIQTNIGTTTNDAWASYQPGGSNATGGASNVSFSLFNPSILAGGTNGITDTGAQLSLFRLTPNTATTTVGTFAINSSGVITFTPPATAFGTWAANAGLSGANATPTATPANDGIENMVKFVLGDTSPASGAPPPLPTASLTGGNLVFSFPYNSASASQFSVAVQTSTDLVNWTTRSAGTVSGGTYTLTIPVGSVPTLFARLLVTEN